MRRYTLKYPSYANQALILQAWGRLEEAMALLKKQETLCLEFANRSGLAYCYWNWGLLAREERDHKKERGKLSATLDIFTELNMPRERDALRAELEKTVAADRATYKLRKSQRVSHQPPFLIHHPASSESCRLLAPKCSKTRLKFYDA